MGVGSPWWAPCARIGTEGLIHCCPADQLGEAALVLRRQLRLQEWQKILHRRQRDCQKLKGIASIFQRKRRETDLIQEKEHRVAFQERSVSSGLAGSLRELKPRKRIVAGRAILGAFRQEQSSCAPPIFAYLHG